MNLNKLCEKALSGRWNDDKATIENGMRFAIEESSHDEFSEYQEVAVVNYVSNGSISFYIGEYSEPNEDDHSDTYDFFDKEYSSDGTNYIFHDESGTIVLRKL